MAISAKESFQLTSKKLLAKNTLWNLVGQIIPALMAVVSVPIIRPFRYKHGISKR